MKSQLVSVERAYICSFFCSTLRDPPSWEMLNQVWKANMKMSGKPLQYSVEVQSRKMRSWRPATISCLLCADPDVAFSV
jgi:hypothetical protein